MSTAEIWLEKLQRHGYRVTAPRRAIVEQILISEHALEPVALFDRTRLAHPGIGLVTVYRTLEKLEELGLIQRVHQENGCHMVMRAAVGHQHYLVCTSCGKTILFKGDDVTDLISNVEKDTGFKVADHWLQFMGECPACKAVRSKNSRGKK